MKMKKLVPSAQCLVLSAKKIIAVALCAVGLSAFAADPVTYLDWDDANKKMTNAVCMAYEVVTKDTATFEAGKTYVVQGTVEQPVHGITVEGTPSNPTRLILCDGAKLTVTGQSAAETAGLNVSNGTAIVICGQKLGTGELVATGGAGAAGIGGNSSQAAGTVTIYGGTVTATGVLYGAGIGGGLYGAGGTVTINGGTVTATAGTDGEKAPTVAIGCCQQSGDNGTVTFGAKFSVVTGETAAVTAPIAQDDYAADHSAKYAHIEPPPSQEISAVSDEGWIDLTVGDRIAAEPEELVVVDPAWGEAKSATVDFAFGASTVETRTYNCASNDLWGTTTLMPGRYTLALTAGTEKGSAAFWKLGDDWVVFDSSNITADVTFEEDKTYLMFGTNTVSGATLTVTDGAKFEYAAGAGFKGGKLEMTKRYGTNVVEGGLYQIVEKIKGCADNPWVVGVGVEAYTNGTELVFVGRGTIADLSEIPSVVKTGIKEVTLNAGVTDAAAGSFYEWDGITVTLPDGWQGELPDEKSTWRGATNVKLTRVPMAVKNVKVQQRYPWNGKVDVDFALSGEGAVKVTLSVTADGKKLKNPMVDGETTFDLGKGGEVKDLRLTWDAKADFGDEEVHQKIKVKLTVAPAELD